MRQYKITIKETPDFWEFQGPAGPFKVIKKNLDIKSIHLELFLELIGFIVEWEK